jgi:hypothetical protein
MTRPLILEGDVLHTYDKQVALCLSIIPSPHKFQKRWSYQMLFDSIIVFVSHGEIQEEIDQGGIIFKNSM